MMFMNWGEINPQGSSLALMLLIEGWEFEEVTAFYEIQIGSD